MVCALLTAHIAPRPARVGLLGALQSLASRRRHCCRRPQAPAARRRRKHRCIMCKALPFARMVQVSAFAAALPFLERGVGEDCGAIALGDLRRFNGVGAQARRDRREHRIGDSARAKQELTLAAKARAQAAPELKQPLKIGARIAPANPARAPCGGGCSSTDRAAARQSPNAFRRRPNALRRASQRSAGQSERRLLGGPFADGEAVVDHESPIMQRRHAPARRHRARLRRSWRGRSPPRPSGMHALLERNAAPFQRQPWPHRPGRIILVADIRACAVMAALVPEAGGEIKALEIAFPSFCGRLGSCFERRRDDTLISGGGDDQRLL